MPFKICLSKFRSKNNVVLCVSAAFRNIVSTSSKTSKRPFFKLCADRLYSKYICVPIGVHYLVCLDRFHSLGHMDSYIAGDIYVDNSLPNVPLCSLYILVLPEYSHIYNYLGMSHYRSVSSNPPCMQHTQMFYHYSILRSSQDNNRIQQSLSYMCRIHLCYMFHYSL